MQAGRVRGKGKTAPTSIQGVKQIIKALRGGEATIVCRTMYRLPKKGATACGWTFSANLPIP